MSVATEISRLQTAKSDIKTAIEAKGVTVPSSAKIDTYDDYITAIPSGASDGYIDNAGVEYVDLGLPSGTLWAKKNVGAATETDLGDQFHWGCISTSASSPSGTFWPNDVNRKLYDAVTASGGEPCCILGRYDEMYFRKNSAGVSEDSNTIWSLVENYNNTGAKVIKISSMTDSTKFIIFPVASQYTSGSNTWYYGTYLWTTYTNGTQNISPYRWVILCARP